MMSFTKQSADLQPIEDTVFAVVAMAKKDIAEHGSEHVVNATIGSLADENGELVAYSSVFDHYNKIDNKIKASYASSFTGNPEYRKQVKNWVLQDQPVTLDSTVIATPGGTGAVNMTIVNMLEPGQTLILPEIAWGSYSLMAAQAGLHTVSYSLFKENRFDLDSFKAVCSEVMKKQHKVLAVINDPCHNPTGYSLALDEWQEIVDFFNELSTQGPCIILNDIAYIDYSYQGFHSRDYLPLFNQLSENVLVVVAFSSSKSLTSYGMRCGAALVMGKDSCKVRETEIVFEKTARAFWSNIPNAAMENFTWVTTVNRNQFLEEKQTYVDLLKQRSTLFLQQSDSCGLPYYPYKEGFFITLVMKNNKERDRIHQLLLDHHIYTVKVNLGIRLAICSLSMEKIDGLPEKIHDLMQ